MRSNSLTLPHGFVLQCVGAWGLLGQVISTVYWLPLSTLVDAGAKWRTLLSSTFYQEMHLIDRIKGGGLEAPGGTVWPRASTGKMPMKLKGQWNHLVNQP